VTCSSRLPLRLALLAALTLPILSIRGVAATTPPAETLATPSLLSLHLPPDPPDRAIFTRAATRSGVPAPILLALSYVQSNWNSHPGVRSIDGGYGLMDLVRSTNRDTLGAAARLAHASPSLLARDDALNVLGGALLLAADARGRASRHILPAAISGWAAAIVLFTGMRTRLAAGVMLRDVYGTLRRGAVVRGPHRTLTLAPVPGAYPDLRALDAPRLTAPSEWKVGRIYGDPSLTGLPERLLPASLGPRAASMAPLTRPSDAIETARLGRRALTVMGYSTAQSTASTTRTAIRPHDDGVDYPGVMWAPSPNYTGANRPDDLSVRYVVIHDTEGGCAASLNWLLNPDAGGSAHFLVCQDGTIYQLVRIHDIAWHAGNWYVNQHSIGIEHEGYRDSGGYTLAQYTASAAVVRTVVRMAGVAIMTDRNSIFGHENVPHATHTDPGPSWDWRYYMGLVRGGTPLDGGDAKIATIARGQVTLYACPSTSCRAMGTANWGEQFAVAGVSRGWDEVYYNGAAAWVAASAVASGAGTRLEVTASPLNVREEPSTGGAIIGTIPRGQVYVSRLRDTALDKAGWWLIPFNHRYGFISSRYVVSVGGVLPTPVATVPPIPTITPSPTASLTASPTPTGSSATPTPTRTPAGTLSPTPTAAFTTLMTTTAPVTATPPTTPTAALTTTAALTATPSATSTVTSAVWPPVTTAITAASTLTATSAVTASPTTTATITVTPSATASPSPTMTATTTATPSPSPSPRPTATRTAHRQTSRRSHVRMSSAAAALVVAPAATRLRAGAGLVLRVHTSATRAMVGYRLDFPGGLTVRATGRTDAHGNSARRFTLPGPRWLRAALARLAAARRPLRGRPSPAPRWLDVHYVVTTTWRRHIIVRSGSFRIVM